MKNNNDDGVAKVNLTTAEAIGEVQETVHKVNLGAPLNPENENENPENDGEDQTADSESSNETKGDSETPAGDDTATAVDDSDDSVTNDSDTVNSTDDQADNSDLDSDFLEEITDEEEVVEDSISADDNDDTVVTEEKEVSVLPENIQKLADFMNETGGTIEDYVKLNVDLDSLNEEEMLRQYHASLEPSLDSEEIDIIMEDLYEVDEDEMTDREMKRKSIEKKRDLGKAKQHLQDQKDKYYDEIKAGSSLTQDQKKAVDFFNRHNEAQEADLKSRAQKQQIFTDKTNKLFNEEFKGFEFKVGEKRYRYNVKDVEGTKTTQSSIENFTKKYLGDDNALKDEKGYHKALFTAMNADAIADHFYKQGQADAIKSSATSKKNIDMGGRKNHGKAVPPTGGMKARVVTVEKGPSSGKLKFKSFSKG